MLFYFFFSVEHTGPGKVVARTGIMFLMIAFGAAFGYTVMARMSLLIGRLTDLIEFTDPSYGRPSLWLLGLTILTLVVMARRSSGKQPKEEVAGSLVDLVSFVWLSRDSPDKLNKPARLQLRYMLRYNVPSLESHCRMSGASGAHNAGCSKWPFSKATGESKQEASPQGYVEDFGEPRTPLVTIWQLLQGAS